MATETIKGPFDFFVYKNGKWHETYYGNGGSATIEYNEHINNYFGGSLVMGNRYPQIIWKQWEQINNGSGGDDTYDTGDLGDLGDLEGLLGGMLGGN